ncbi:MAG TPA: D-arabinono-1,4-lactone oxidase [Micromonosporaceae bacterium]|nr:D-arabinono-1,4-lactone oxidase [Micromonosporaceae bacterium]
MSSASGAAWRNWSGNQRATAVRVVRPRSTAEVAAAVHAARRDGLRVKPVGSGHSFTAAAATDGVRLDLRALDEPVAVDRDRRLVTVPAGMRLRTLNALLAAHGLALPNLGDIDAQTVAGALATGTHGTGAGYGCLSTFLAGLDLVTAEGTVVSCSPAAHPDVFTAAQVGLGALGVVTAVTLRCVDAFVLEADERPTPLAETLSRVDELATANDHFEFYWQPYTERTLVKRNNRVAVDSRPLSKLKAWWENDFLQNVAFGAVCRLGRAVPALAPPLMRGVASFFSPVTYTRRSDRVFVTPRRVRFVEMEYGLPRAALPEAFAALRRIVDGLPFPLLLPVEVRVVAADDIWLSHGYGRDSVYIAIHQYVGMPYEPYFHAFEQVCAGLGGRPHWGKLHWRDAASLAPAYPRFADFLAVRDKLDPDRVFANAYVERVLGA